MKKQNSTKQVQTQMIDNILRRLSLIVLLPLGLLIFWASLFVVNDEKIKKVWRDIANLK